MKRGFTPVFIILALVLLAGGGFVFLRSRTAAPTSTTPTTAPQESDDSTMETTQEGTESKSDDTISGNFFELLKSPGAKECEWSVPAPTGGQQLEPGKVWSAGNKARRTFKTKSAGTADEVEVNAIMKDSKIYSWVSLGAMGSFGMVFDQKDIEEFEQLPAAEQEQAKQYQEKVEFNCKPWKVDESKFELPAGVKFQTTQ